MSKYTHDDDVNDRVIVVDAVLYAGQKTIDAWNRHIAYVDSLEQELKDLYNNEDWTTLSYRYDQAKEEAAEWESKMHRAAERAEELEQLLLDSQMIVNHIGCAGCLNNLNMKEGGVCYNQMRRFENTVRELSKGSSRE